MFPISRFCLCGILSYAYLVTCNEMLIISASLAVRKRKRKRKRRHLHEQRALASLLGDKHVIPNDEPSCRHSINFQC